MAEKIEEQEEKDSEKNEKLLPGSQLISLKPILETERAICKIRTPKHSGSGFFIQLSKRDENFLCLMTNEHVITKEMIEEKVLIEIQYDNEKKIKIIELNPYERTIEEFTYMDIDLTAIEILPTDKIKNEYFLLPSIYYMNNYKKLKNEEITIIQYPKGILSLSNGKIEKINHYTFSHSASTEHGSSGSPIFLKDTTKVIGIHKSASNDEPDNKGNFIGPIYNYFKNLPKYKDKKIIAINNNNVSNSQINILLTKIINDDGSYYIGQTKNNLPDGKGKEYYENGNLRYKGDFINGKKEGNGKYIYENGNYYIGEWKNDLKHGKGKLYDKDNKIIYEGDFINGKKNIRLQLKERPIKFRTKPLLFPKLFFKYD